MLMETLRSKSVHKDGNDWWQVTATRQITLVGIEFNIYQGMINIFHLADMVS